MNADLIKYLLDNEWKFVGMGSGRAVYRPINALKHVKKNIVIKVPFDGSGVFQNIHEAAMWKLREHDHHLAACRLIRIKAEIPTDDIYYTSLETGLAEFVKKGEPEIHLFDYILIMEYVNTEGSYRGQIYSWAGKYNGQIGPNKQGKLVAYDYGS